MVYTVLKVWDLDEIQDNFEDSQIYFEFSNLEDHPCIFFPLPIHTVASSKE